MAWFWGFVVKGKLIQYFQLASWSISWLGHIIILILLALLFISLSGSHTISWGIYFPPHFVSWVWLLTHWSCLCLLSCCWCYSCVPPGLVSLFVTLLMPFNSKSQLVKTRIHLVHFRYLMLCVLNMNMPRNSPLIKLLQHFNIILNQLPKFLYSSVCNLPANPVNFKDASKHFSTHSCWKHPVYRRSTMMWFWRQSGKT